MKLLEILTSATLLLFLGCSSSTQVTYTDVLEPSSVTVVLDNGSQLVMTDSDGNWSFNNVPVGTHEVLVSKTGFGQEELYNIQVAPGGVVYAPQANLCPVPTQTLHIDSVRLQDSTPPLPSNAQWYISFTHDPGAQGIAVFLDSTPNVSPTDEHIFSDVNGGNLGQTHNFANNFSFLPALIHHGYHSGAKLYLSACIFNGLLQGYGVGSYYDPTGDQMRVVAAGPKSNVVVFIMP